jgi:hypothetical protein
MFRNNSVFNFCFRNWIGLRLEWLMSHNSNLRSYFASFHLILNSKLLFLPRSIQVRLYHLFKHNEGAASIAAKFKGGVEVIPSTVPGGMAGNLGM